MVSISHAWSRLVYLRSWRVWNAQSCKTSWHLIQPTTWWYLRGRNPAPLLLFTLLLLPVLLLLLFVRIRTIQLLLNN